MDINAVLRGLEGDPWSADLTLGAGLLLHAMKNDEDAGWYFRRFMQIAPNSPVIQKVEK